MKLLFEKGMWEDRMVYAYSKRFNVMPEFVQNDGYIRNGHLEETDLDKPFGFPYENIPLFFPDRKKKETKITTTCSFNRYGAPLICFAADLYEEDGILRFSDYLEVVVHAGGLNIWKLWEEKGKVDFKLLMGLEYPVPGKVNQTISAYFNGSYLNVEHNGRRSCVYIPDVLGGYYYGITACEHINFFYDVTIEDPSEYEPFEWPV